MLRRRGLSGRRRALAGLIGVSKTARPPRFSGAETGVILPGLGTELLATSFAIEMDVVTTLGGLSASLIDVESIASLHASGVLGCL